VVIDPEAAWRVTEETLVSRGKNTPLLGAELRGKVIAVIRSGASERSWMDSRVTDRISVGPSHE
jgi:dihydroorotase-like cyclic amidohydrolase